jgi:hypothetical protein
MKIPIEVVVDVDVAAWAERFGVAPMKVEPSVQVYFAGLVIHELRELGLDTRLEPPTEKVPTTPRQTGHPRDVEFRDKVAQMGTTQLLDLLQACANHRDGDRTIVRTELRRRLSISPGNQPADPGAREFRDDDAGYLAWLAGHPDGYVINIARSQSATEARVHLAGCRTISGQKHGAVWTGPYVKVCAEHLSELGQWAIDQVGEAIPACGICHPAGDAVQPTSTKPTEPTVAPPMPEGRCEIHESTADSAVVEAWANDYIRFERRPVWQEQLRTEIRSRCQQLEPSAGQVLHATFFGAKHPNADVENLVLYYIDSFKVAGRNGIRFEHGAAVPPAPDGARYPFCYRYALAPRSSAFADWQHGRTLALFDWTDLGAFAGEKNLAQVWLALARGQIEVFEPCAPETPFALRVQVRPPQGSQPVWGGLVKGIFDGVICALQAHTDAAVLPEIVARLARDLPADPVDIEEHLLDQRRAVLGAVPRLVSPYGAGVKWDPSDHLCVAGELLSAEPAGPGWAIRGELVELSR